MSKREGDAPRRGGRISDQILNHLGTLLNEARTRKGRDETLERAAAALLGADKEGASEAKSNKANLSNIENGKVALPWKRIVKFSDYTGANPAAVMILLAAARTLRDIEDPTEQARLESEIKSAFSIHPDKSLVELMERIGLRPLTAVRNFLRSRYPQGLWSGLQYLELICPRLARLPGAYFDLAADSAILSTAEERGASKKVTVIHGKSSSGGELVLWHYLRVLEAAIPLDVDAENFLRTSRTELPDLAAFLDAGISRLNLDTDPKAILSAPVLIVFRNLPRSLPGLRRVHDAAKSFLDSRLDAKGFVVADDYIPQDWLTDVFQSDGACFTTAPLREADGLAVLDSCCGATPDLDDWQLLAVRHPLLLAAMVTVFQKTGRLPNRWEAIRAVANAMVNGKFEAPYTGQGLFPKRTPQLELLAKVAVDSLLDVRRGMEWKVSKGVEPIDYFYPLVTHRENTASFAFASLHYYFAALHFLWSAEHRGATNTIKAIQKIATELAQSGDQAGSANFLDAIESEAFFHRLPICSDIQSRAARAKRSAPSSRGSAAKTVGSRSHDRRRWSHDDLYILIEDQEPAQALKRLLNSPLIEKPAGFEVEIFTARYRPIAAHLEAMLRADTSTAAARPREYDIVACPHYCLADAIASAKLCVELDGEISKLLSKSIVARQYCRQDGHWYAVPYQYPTKFLCQRRSGPASHPIPLGTWDDFELFLSQSSQKLVLQAQPGHPSLYYEWLAFALAMGGGDILWSPSATPGTVILDTPQTVTATERFIGLIRKRICHPKSIITTWDNLIQLLVEDKFAGLALPFSDTIPVAFRRTESDFEFQPFGPFQDVPPPPMVQTLGFEGLPRHILTAHVFVVLNPEEEIVARAKRFFQWFLSDQVQRRFLVESLHSVWPDRYVDREQARQFENGALRTAAVAQQYGFLPTHDKTPLSENRGQHTNIVLSRGQEIVLDAISDLVANEHTEATKVLAKAASALRKTAL